jgi:hypothetical protein
MSIFGKELQASLCFIDNDSTSPTRREDFAKTRAYEEGSELVRVKNMT